MLLEHKRGKPRWCTCAGGGEGRWARQTARVATSGPRRRRAGSAARGEGAWARAALAGARRRSERSHDRGGFEMRVISRTRRSATDTFKAHGTVCKGLLCPQLQHQHHSHSTSCIRSIRNNRDTAAGCSALVKSPSRRRSRLVISMRHDLHHFCLSTRLQAVREPRRRHDDARSAP